MAFPDWHNEQKYSVQQKQPRVIAAPFDRQLAFYFNFLIFSPLLTILLSGLFADLKISLHESTEGTSSYTVFVVIKILLGWILTWSLLEAFCVYWMKATPGAKFMQLQIVDSDHKIPQFLKTFVRSLLWWISLPLFIPLVSIHRHPQRRSFAESATETTTLSLKNTQPSVPAEFEKQIASSWGTVAFLFLCFMVLNIFIEFDQQISQGVVVNTPQQINYCDERFVEFSTAQKLDIALLSSLTAKKEVSCLRQVAQDILWGQREPGEIKAQAYAVMGWLESDQKKYKSLACKDKRACELYAFLKTDKKKWNTEELTELKSLIEATNYLSLKALFVSRVDLSDSSELTLNYLEDLAKYDFLNSWLEKQTVRLFWNFQTQEKTQQRTPAGVSDEQTRVEKEIKKFKEKYNLL